MMDKELLLPETNRQVLLKHRPKGIPDRHHFEIIETLTPDTISITYARAAHALNFLKVDQEPVFRINHMVSHDLFGLLRFFS